MIPIPNQPVYFGGEDACSDDVITPQLVDLTDTTQFQLLMEVCEGTPNMITNNTFDDDTDWEVGGNWSISGNLLCHATGSSDTSWSTVTLNENNYYEVTIIVDSITFGASFDVFLGSQLIGTITTIGTFTFWGFPIDDSGITSVLISTGTDGDICISEIDVYLLPLNEIVQVKDLDGNVVGTLGDKDGVVQDNTMTFNVDWSEYVSEEICLVICLLDACTRANINDCEFNFNPKDMWLHGTDWTYGGGIAEFTYSPVPERGDNVIYQDNVFPAVDTETEYCVTIELTGAGTGVLNVYFGYNLVASLTGAGVYTVTGTCTDNATLMLEGTVGNLVVTSCCPCDLPLGDCDYTSNVFKVGDYSNGCTKVINICNNENGLGFVFGSNNFSPRIRIECKIKRAKYASERNNYTDSKGTKKNYYYSGRKQKQLCTDQQPEYVHDFLRLLLGADNVFIDNVAYSVDDDEYNVEYADVNDNVGKVRLLISEQTQNVKNVNCSDTVKNCNLAP